VAGRSGFRFPAGVRNFSKLQNIQNISGPSQTSFQWASGFFPPGSSGGVEKLSNHVYLVPRLRMNEPLIFFPLYAFMLWTGTILRLSCRFSWHLVC